MPRYRTDILEGLGEIFVVFNLGELTETQAE